MWTVILSGAPRDFSYPAPFAGRGAQSKDLSFSDLFFSLHLCRAGIYPRRKQTPIVTAPFALIHLRKVLAVTTC